MTPNPPDNRYRRRFLVEFTASESDLAERLGALHGSKRRAIVTGLQLLESGSIESLRAQVAALENERDAAKAAVAKAAESLKAAKEQAAAAREQASGAKETVAELKAERAAHNKTKAELAQAKREIATAGMALASAQSDLQRYASALPTMAYCPDCGKFVPATQWSERAAKGGVVHVYHSKHEYRPKGSITKYPSVMFWRGGTE
jgi:DNA repair exonuclease SbcCD ATPase subunit